MRRMVAALGALALALPATASLEPAQAQTHYSGKSSRHARYYKVCRHTKGRTGLIAGGVVGALAGPAVIGHGLLGAVVGGAGGALGGRAIERGVTAKQRCRYVRR